MDLSNDEFKSIYLGTTKQRPTSKIIIDTKVGDSVDWRTKGAV